MEANTLIGKLERAHKYKAQITRLINQKKDTPFASQLAPISDKLNLWEMHLRQLDNKVRDFEKNKIIQRDLIDVPAAITKLQAQLKVESNPQMRTEIMETLARYEQHHRQLNELVTMMRRIELDIDETVAAIGAIYSQLQLLDTKEIDSSRVKRLSGDIDEQANRLGDLLHAMDDVYDSTSNFQLNA